MNKKYTMVRVEFGETTWNGIQVKITIRRDERERVYDRYNEDSSFQRLCEAVNNGSWELKATEDGWMTRRFLSA